MPLFQSPYLNFLLETLIAEFIVTIAGVLVARTIINWWTKYKYGGWTMIVIKNRDKKLDQIPITPAKMKQVTDIPEDMPVFLKGMCSPYHIVGCDLMRKGVELGVLKIDQTARRILIDLDKDQDNESAKVQTSSNHIL